MSKRDDAKRLLNHYFGMVAERSGMKVDRDTTAEIDSIVDLIIDATCDEVSDRMLRELRNQTRR